ncbi:MAG: hypothetical protein ACM3YM_10020 [Sphingomonadales bacterium]
MRTAIGGAQAMPSGATRKLLMGAAVLVAAAVVLFVLRSPEPDAPAALSGASSAAGGGSQKLDDVDTMIARLGDRLKKNPTDGEGYRMLGWSYVMTGRPEKAIDPYKRALALLPGSAVVHSGYGEALVAVARNIVTPEARAEFERAVGLDAKEPRALYFLALWMAQHGQEREALDKWITLANSGPADAPWQAELRTRITETAAKLGVDVSARLKSAPPASAEQAPIDASAMQAANRLSVGERQTMIDDMVEGLAKKLKANPNDADGWVRLLRSRMVLKQTGQARDDLGLARRALTGDAAGLNKVNAAAAEFGVPGV